VRTPTWASTRAAGAATRTPSRARAPGESQERSGEWRALDALVNRVLGKPTEHVKHEHDHAGTVTVEAVRAMSSAERRALLAQARALPAGDVVEVDAVELGD
jgi:hypothetical protein